MRGDERRTDEDAVGWGVEDITDALCDLRHCGRVEKGTNVVNVVEGCHERFTSNQEQELSSICEVTSRRAMR